MKLSHPIRRQRAAVLSAGLRAFTLPEILIALTIFVVVIGGILSSHIFGLRMFQVNATKLTATRWSRETFGQIADEVRSSSSISLGNLNSTNNQFEGLLEGEKQQGTALQIIPGNSVNTSEYILYFLNASDQTFRRMTDQPKSTVVLADSVTNMITFTGLNFSGDLLTSIATSNNPVIHLRLDFYQPERFLRPAQQYKLETSMSRR